MSAPSCEFDQPSIVFVGSFNPRLFQPRWLGAKGLLPEAEADSAEITVIHADLCSFRVGTWLTLQVTQDRFIALSDEAHAGALRDLVLGLFRLLEHTPVTQLGINRGMHFRLASAADRMSLGRSLASPDPWKDMLQEPVMRSLTIQGRRPTSPAARLHVKVEPSSRPSLLDIGVALDVNEHFETAESDSLTALLAMLSSEWEASLDFAKQLASKILKGTADG